MFDRTEDEIKACQVTIYIDNKTSRFINEFAQVKEGWNEFDYIQITELYNLCCRMLINIPKYQYKTVRGFINTLATSYGPDMGMKIVR